MHKFVKRTLALVLVVCLLTSTLAVAGFTVSATGTGAEAGSSVSYTLSRGQDNAASDLILQTIKDQVTAKSGKYSDGADVKSDSNYEILSTKIVTSGAEASMYYYMDRIAFDGETGGDFIRNVPLTDAMSAHYNNKNLNWELLGVSYNTRQFFANGWLQIDGFNNTSKYVAFQLRAPGEGTYTLDLTTYIMNGAAADGNLDQVAPLWLDAYVVELADGMEDSQWATYLSSAAYAGSYKPAYGGYAKRDSVSGSLMTYTFKQDTNYILYLKMNTDEQVDIDKTNGDGKYMTPNLYLMNITATRSSNQEEEPAGITYDLNYQGVVAAAAAKMGTSITSGGSALYDYIDTNNDGTKDSWVLRTQILDAFERYYGKRVYDGVDYGDVILNYKFAGLEITEDEGQTREVQFQNRDYCKGIRAYTKQGDWFAFWIQTPTTKDTYDVTLSRYLSQYGADDASVYILSMDAAEDTNTETAMNEAMNAAIETAMASAQGYPVSYHKTGTGYSSSDPSTNKTAAESVKLGQWTADEKPEHIVVFKANGTDNTQNANMYPAVLTLTPAEPDSGNDETIPEDTTPDETVPEVEVSPVYNFDYQTYLEETAKAMGLTKEQLPGGGADLYKDGVLHKKITGYMDTYYADGTLNWKYAALEAEGNVTFYKGYGLRAFTAEGEWVAFWIKNPGAGTYNVYLDYYQTTYGATESDVYIIPAITDAADMNAAIEAAMTAENKLCSGRSFFNASYTKKSPYENDPASKVTNGLLGTWTAGGAKDYIIVFKAVTSGDGTNAFMYPVQLQLTTETLTDGTPADTGGSVTPVIPPNAPGGTFDREYPAGTSVYSFDYKNAVDADGTDRKDGGVNLYTGGVISEGITGYMNAYYASGVLNWKFTGIKMSGDAIFKKGYGLWASSADGDWIAFTIKNPGEGTYHVYLDYLRSRYGASDSEVYIIPAVASSDKNAAIEAALTEANRIYDGLQYAGDFSSKYPEDNGSVAAATKKLGTWTAGNAEEYIVVFKATANSTFDQRSQYGYMYPAQLILSKEVLTNVDLIVDRETVAEDAVASTTASITFTCTVNGHDYMYMFMRDYKMLVYDLDTKTLVDVQNNVFIHPRNATVDSKGNMWACGLGNYLYRYDPVAKKGEQISFKASMFPQSGTLNLYGITVDENDNVYFGTSSSAYIGMYDQKTGQITKISKWLNTSTTLAPDAYYGGYGGLIVKDGYVYMVIEGDQNGDYVYTHELIKYSLAENRIVDWIDIAPYMTTPAGQYRYVSKVGENHIMCSVNAMMTDTVLVDISGEKMQLVENTGDLDFGAYGYVTGAVNGKVYCTGNTKHGEGLFEIDLATMTVTELDKTAFPADMVKLLVQGNGLVTIEGDEDLPGVSIITFRNNAENGAIEPIFYNVQTGKTVIWEAFTAGVEGTGNQLRCIVSDPDRKNIYTGAYGYNVIAKYNVSQGKVTDLLKSYDHQTDGLVWYNGYLYAGNYSKCSITKVDVENGTAKSLFAINGTVFNQYRCHALAAGGDKVFLGTTPGNNRLGGMLVWYDLNKNLTYVAAGPNPEDVYYANTTSAPYVWYSALTNELMDFDEDDDGKDDDSITVNGVQVPRFTGLIKNQDVNCMVYKDGYIYGTTTIYGGSGSTPEAGNACMFVYDVAAMKVIATCDLNTVLGGFDTQIEWIDVIEEDPVVKGKFWGVVADTLFSFTFDPETATYTVKEELSMGKDNYQSHSNKWDHRSIVFDGNYMYIIFGNNGTYMVNRSNPQDYKRLSAETPKQMAMGEDGNLYYFFKSADLYVLRVAEITQPLVAKSVQEMIDALPDAVTQEHVELVAGVRRAYDALIEPTKALVDITKLLAAETVTDVYRAAQVQQMIDALPAKITADNAYLVTQARAAYEALTEAAKKMVDITKLLAAEKIVAAFQAVSNPNTGDTVYLLLLSLALSAAAMAVLLPGRRRRNAAR